jgi:hypothetical protein
MSCWASITHSLKRRSQTSRCGLAPLQNHEGRFLTQAPPHPPPSPPPYPRRLPRSSLLKFPTSTPATPMPLHCAAAAVARAGSAVLPHTDERTHPCHGSDALQDPPFNMLCLALCQASKGYKYDIELQAEDLKEVRCKQPQAACVGILGRHFLSLHAWCRRGWQARGQQAGRIPGLALVSPSDTVCSCSCTAAGCGAVQGGVQRSWEGAASRAAGAAARRHQRRLWFVEHATRRYAGGNSIELGGTGWGVAGGQLSPLAARFSPTQPIACLLLVCQRFCMWPTLVYVCACACVCVCACACVCVSVLTPHPPTPPLLCSQVS